MSNYATSNLLGQVLSNECPSREILEHLTTKWSVLVLRCLSDGIHRFSELRQRIDGMSEKMLALYKSKVKSTVKEVNYQEFVAASYGE